MSLSTPLLEKLLKLPPFDTLKEAEAKAFFEGATEKTVPAGKALFQEGEEGTTFVLVMAGEVTVTKKGVELAALKGPAVLGEMALLGGEARSASATAKSELTVLELPSKRVQERLAAADVASLKVVANLAKVMSRRLALINDKLVDSLGGSKRKEELADFGRILNRWSF
jgi:CRP/FNR family cyclic AMP-dependent transcriptional regulator